LFNPRKIRNLPVEYDLGSSNTQGGPEGRSRGPVVSGALRWLKERGLKKSRKDLNRARGS